MKAFVLAVNQLRMTTASCEPMMQVYAIQGLSQQRLLLGSTAPIVANQSLML